MELRKIGNLDIGTAVRHAAFLSEDRVAVSTRTGDIFEVPFGDSTSPRLLLKGSRVLKPVARALRQWRVKPAGGGYPRLAASPGGRELIVNTHDAVLVACSLSDAPPRLIAKTWGIYYPPIQFSPDGEWLRAGDEPLLVFHVPSWRGWELPGLETAAWQPGRPGLLALDGERRLRRLDLGKDLENPAPGPPLGDLTNGAYDPVGLFLNTAGDRGLAVFENGDLIGFALEPFRRLETQSWGNGVLWALSQPSNAPWIVLENEAGLRFWDLEENRPLTGFLPGMEICASPSGRRLVLLGGSINPYPAAPVPEWSAGFWEISP